VYEVGKPESSKGKVNTGGWLFWEKRDLIKKQNLRRIKGAKPECKVKQVMYSGLILGLLISPVLNYDSLKQDNKPTVSTFLVSSLPS